MKTLLLSLTLFCFSCTDKVPHKVYCQGFVVRELIRTPDQEELSRTFTLKCNGQCPGGKPCSVIKKEFNPAKPGNIVSEEWCGCPGDEAPLACDVVLTTYNFDGRIVQQADCTKGTTCPTSADSCVQQPTKEVIDTIRNAQGADSLYKYTGQITCECEPRRNL